MNSFVDLPDSIPPTNMHIRIFEYYGQRWNGQIIDNFKNELSKKKNDYDNWRLKNIFRPPRSNISLFLNAVEHDADFAAYLIQFAIDNHVDSSILLDSVCGRNPLHVAIKKRNYELVEMILKFAADGGSCASLFDLNSYHGTPFQTAIWVHHVQILKEEMLV